LIHVGIAYLAIQLIAFTTFMLFPALPVWLAVVLCSIILALFALCAVVGRVGINEVNRAEDKIKTKRAFISFLQIDVDMLAQCEQDIETKTALKKLSENVRFSDPMSHEMLEELETKIAARVEELKTVTDKKTLINEIEILLSERNKKCKALK